MAKQIRVTGLGWPMANGTCARSRLISTRLRHEHDPTPAPTPVPSRTQPGPPMAGPPIALAVVPGALTGRHPVIRRDPDRTLPALVRFAVLLRDWCICKRCGAACTFDRRAGHWTPAVPHVDHVTPWSAGGADRTENLRVLCAPCNLGRSNYRDEAETRVLMPATWWCLECWGEDAEPCCGGRCWIHTARTAEGIPLPAELIVGRFAADRLWDGDSRRLAYCAHCRVENYTTAWL